MLCRGVQTTHLSSFCLFFFLDLCRFSILCSFASILVPILCVRSFLGIHYNNFHSTSRLASLRRCTGYVFMAAAGMSIIFYRCYLLFTTLASSHTVFPTFTCCCTWQFITTTFSTITTICHYFSLSFRT